MEGLQKLNLPVDASALSMGLITSVRWIVSNMHRLHGTSICTGISLSGCLIITKIVPPAIAVTIIARGRRRRSKRSRFLSQSELFYLQGTNRGGMLLLKHLPNMAGDMGQCINGQQGTIAGKKQNGAPPSTREQASAKGGGTEV